MHAEVCFNHAKDVHIEDGHPIQIEVENRMRRRCVFCWSLSCACILAFLLIYQEDSSPSLCPYHDICILISMSRALRTPAFLFSSSLTLSGQVALINLILPETPFPPLGWWGIKVRRPSVYCKTPKEGYPDIWGDWLCNC